MIMSKNCFIQNNLWKKILIVEKTGTHSDEPEEFFSELEFLEFLTWVDLQWMTSKYSDQDSL